ncbi:MAG TPA: FAD-dependent oxidoreductase [Thermoanaerobaculia bacterium]|jgi:glycine/D-amino acid oxidase-like deaminating enzyme/nitrite reductase/ring-hydroxylating ferredoxin subunit
MDRLSFWEGTGIDLRFPPLASDVEADVAIVGGGITGITAAQLLAAAGKRVAVIEARSVGLGTTGHSTGNLHTVVDNYLYAIRKKWGDEVLRTVAQTRQEMIGFIEETVSRYGIECGFARRRHYLFMTDESQRGDFDKEHEALRVSGLPFTQVDRAPLPVPSIAALAVENQAQFHPLTYTRALAKAIQSDQCRVFEYSKAVEIDAREHVVRTSLGSVRAEKIILATHTPKGFHLVQTELGPYREYGIAATLASGEYPDGIFWSFESPHHSIRSYEHNGRKYLIVIGEKHKVGQQDNSDDYYGKVEAFAREHFDIATIDYRWSGQHYHPADELPFIGQSGHNDDLYIATGFSTSGLIYGPLAAHILSAAILGGEHPAASVYRANRFTPIKSAENFTKENVDVAKQMVKDYVRRAEVDAITDVGPGEGKIAEIDGKKVALYRDDQGQWTAVSPVCTHMGCIVHFNRFEKTWDCPCHGSRFDTNGEVIEGPAINPLERKPIE